MALTISFANQKGGVGKTLTTSSVARILTLKGLRSTVKANLFMMILFMGFTLYPD